LDGVIRKSEGGLRDFLGAYLAGTKSKEGVKEMMSKRNVTVAGLAAAVVGMVPALVHAAEASVGADIATAYVWRGITFNDEGAFQPWVDVSHESGVGVNVWANMDIGDFRGANDDGEFSEVDLTLYYSLPVEVVDITVGYIHYMFPQLGADTTTGEFYTSLGYSPVDMLSLGANVYYDYDEIGSFYLSFTSSLDLLAMAGGGAPEGFSAEVSAGIGLAGKEFAKAYGGREAGFFDYNVGASIGYDVTDSLALKTFVKFTDSADTDVLPDQEVDVFGGAGVSYSF
jgi:uncharacterized protein (TIGR02001 family)